VQFLKGGVTLFKEFELNFLVVAGFGRSENDRMFPLFALFENNRIDFIDLYSVDEDFNFVGRGGILFVDNIEQNRARLTVDNIVGVIIGFALEIENIKLGKFFPVFIADKDIGNRPDNTDDRNYQQDVENLIVGFLLPESLQVLFEVWIYSVEKAFLFKQMPALQPGKTGHDAGEDAERNQRRIKADAPGSEPTITKESAIEVKGIELIRK
jgi:hypothetical protein